MTSINVLLEKRAREVWRIDPDSTVFEALKFLADHNIGAVMVMQDEKLVGIFSERDYTRKIALSGKTSKNTLVKEIMSAQVLTIAPNVSIKDGLALMSQRGVRHIPVVDGAKVLGMVSMRDIMHFMIADHELTISHLQNYISS